MKKSEEHLLSIRMPGTLVKRLDKVATQAERTRSAEIRYRLEQSLKPVRRPRTPSGVQS